MKCPYQTKTIHKPERDDGYVKHYVEDITMFIECLKEECPFYYENKTEGRCYKAVNEGRK